MARSLGFTGGIAGLTTFKAGTLIWSCIFRHGGRPPCRGRRARRRRSAPPRPCHSRTCGETAACEGQREIATLRAESLFSFPGAIFEARFQTGGAIMAERNTCRRENAFDNPARATKAESSRCAIGRARPDKLAKGERRVRGIDDAGEQRRVDGSAALRAVLQGRHVVNGDQFAGFPSGWRLHRPGPGRFPRSSCGEPSAQEVQHGADNPGRRTIGLARHRSADRSGGRPVLQGWKAPRRRRARRPQDHKRLSRSG